MRPGEPVYAQVDREKKKNSRAAAANAASAVAGDHAALPQYNHNAAYADYSEHAEHWHQQQQQQQQQPQQHVSAPQQSGNAAAGDSWV